MPWVALRVGGGERIGVVVGDEIHVARGATRIVDLLGDDGEQLARAADAARRDPERVVARADAALLAPIPRPPTIRDFYAFEAHVATARRTRGLDMEPAWYEQPVFYFSNPYAVIGPGVSVARPAGCVELDYELEVAAVVGRGGRDLTPDAGEEAIAGFCIMNDWSARDLQRAEMRLNLGPAKGKDFATSLGPYFVTPDELDGTVYDLVMTARVNGVEYSRGRVGDIHWPFGALIAYASRDAYVAPGDVVGSGTCGTGCILELAAVHGSDTYPWLEAGDVVELQVGERNELGVLANPIGARNASGATV